jgi:hypothetical protein
MIEGIKKHSGKVSIAAYTALIIFTANLLIEHGEVKAMSGYRLQSLEQCIDDLYKAEDKVDAFEKNLLINSRI